MKSTTHPRAIRASRRPKPGGLNATLIPCEEGGFTVTCEEFPGAISEGETREEAISNLLEAIRAIVEASNDLAMQKVFDYSKRGPSAVKSKIVGGV